MADPNEILVDVQQFLRDYRARSITRDVANIAAERAKLESCDYRPLRQLAFTSIRRSQRSLARAADEIIAEAAR